jgi:hypothetical protein
MENYTIIIDYYNENIIKNLIYYMIYFNVFIQWQVKECLQVKFYRKMNGKWILL